MLRSNTLFIWAMDTLQCNKWCDSGLIQDAYGRLPPLSLKKYIFYFKVIPIKRVHFHSIKLYVIIKRINSFCALQY